MGKKRRKYTKQERIPSPNEVDWDRYVFEGVRDGTFPLTALTHGLHDRNERQDR